jgi:segregation and condensation protein B
LRFGLKDLQELPSVEEFEKLISAEQQEEAVAEAGSGVADATGVPELPEVSVDSSAQEAPRNASEEQAVNEQTEPSEPAVSEKQEAQEVQHNAGTETTNQEQPAAKHAELAEASDGTAENSESGDSGSDEDREIQLNADMEPMDQEAEEQPEALEPTELPAEHDVQHNASTEPMDEEHAGKERTVSAEASDGNDTEGHN